LGVRHVLPIVTPDDLAKVTVEQRAGKALRLGAVAEVVTDHQPLIGDAVIDDSPGLMLIVEKLPWGNTLEVTRGVEAALQEMRPGLPGIQIDSTIFRPATFVEAAIGNLSRALLLGSLLVILILVLFLYDWRAAVISAVAIPLSLLAAGLVLYLRATTINTMILAGLVISVGWWSTTPSSTSRTSCGGCACIDSSTATGRWPQPRGSCSAPRWRSAARSSMRP